MGQAYLSFLLASFTVINTLATYLFIATPTLAIWISITTYGLWLFFFFFRIRVRPTPGDWITIFRFGLFLIFLFDFIREPAASWIAAAFMTFILLLDGVDGWLARKTNTVSSHGRVLDMEVDHIVTSILVIISVLFLEVGTWFLSVNLYRPIYLLLSKDGRRGEEYRSRLRVWRGKTICVLSLAFLIANLSPLLNSYSRNLLSALNALMLFYSFFVDFLADHKSDLFHFDRYIKKKDSST